MDVHTVAKLQLMQALCASLHVTPMDPGLTETELKEVVLEGGGITGPVFDEVAEEILGRADGARGGRFTISAFQLHMMLAVGDGHYPQNLAPHGVLAKVNAAFEELEAQVGKRGVKTALMIRSACPGEPVDRVDRAIGFLLALGVLRREGDGFIRESSYDYSGPQHSRDTNPWAKPIELFVPLVEKVVAKRSGSLVPSTPPLDRFHVLLQRQGLNEFANWWAMTTREMHTTGEQCPTATAVLAGALLEGALVAIAGPAKAAGEWKQSFLNDPPRTWQLRDLIKQAENAKTFSRDDAAHAVTVAEMRNRIHAGGLAASSGGPIIPASTDAHHARLAKLHLERLVEVILKWPPIARL